MQIRKISDKTQRVKIVTWMRSGAPLSKGVALYASLPHNVRLLTALQKNAEAYEKEMVLDICTMLGISTVKFNSIKNQYNDTKKNAGTSRNRNVGRETQAKNRKAKRPGSFRQEWPFLSKPECPPELKALAADKISCWERYTANHKKLFDCGTLEECSEIAHQIVKDYKENRQIFEEFEHYQKNGKLLGVHPVFNHYKTFKQLRGKNVIALVTLHEKTLPHRIWRIKNEIEKGDKPHLRANREKRLHEVEGELAEVKRLLGMNG